MAGCRIVNIAMESAKTNIDTIKTSYTTAGETFIQDLNNAIAEMEGEAKDALKKFIDHDVQKFVVEDLPGALDGMSQLLEANRTNFVDVDLQIANSISGS